MSQMTPVYETVVSGPPQIQRKNSLSEISHDWEERAGNEPIYIYYSVPEWHDCIEHYSTWVDDKYVSIRIKMGGGGN